MFGKDDGDANEGATPGGAAKFGGRGREERRVAAWIGASVVIDGNVKSSEDMTIAGEVDGDVDVPEHGVVIAAGATIRGDIVARAVEVHGRVTGTITADRRVEVGATGSIEGEIVAPRLMVAEGAALHGRITVAAARTAGTAGTAAATR